MDRRQIGDRPAALPVGPPNSAPAALSRSSAWLWKSQLVNIQRFAALSQRLANKRLEFRPRPGVGDRPLPPIILVLSQQKPREISDFAPLIFRQLFAKTD